VDDHHEEYERIPWSELTSAASPPRGRMLYVAAALVGAVVVGVVVGRTLDSPSPEAAAPETSIPAGGDEMAVDPTSTEPAPSTVTTSAGGGVYSEADLMAAPPTGPERVAAVRAEWFVYDYFTADLEPSGTADILGALPSGVELPLMPQDASESLSYVEWARAFRVDEVEEGLYRVGVLFRLLGAPPDRGFSRMGPRAVEVMVAVSADGGTTVVDLPSPIGLPAAPEPGPWPESVAPEEVPAEMIEAATAAVGAWGSEPRFVSGQPIDGGWRIVLTLADEVGNRWPVAVRFDSGGARIG